MKNIQKICSLIFAVIFAAAGFLPAAAAADEETLINGIISARLQSSSSQSVQSWIDGELTVDAGQGSEWFILALANYGDYDFSAYKEALEAYLSQNEVGSASSRLKFALTFIAIGDKANPYIKKVVDNSIGAQGIMSFVFGLHILNNGFKSKQHSVNGIINELLTLQLQDGGWAVSGVYGDVDVTAMTVQALAPHRKTNPNVNEAIEKSLLFLSERQLESGCYSSYGLSNPESVAQVIVALSSLGEDILGNNGFIKNSNDVFDGINIFRLPDGSFCHKENGNSDSTATAQVLAALIAYRNMKIGKSPFYIFEEPQTVEKSETSLPETTVADEKTTAEYVTGFSETEKNEQLQNSFAWKIIAFVLALAIIIFVAAAIKKRSFLLLTVAIICAALLIYFSFDRDADNSAGTVSISISCDAVKNEEKVHIPSNGIILAKTEVTINCGDSVYDVLADVCRENNILFSPIGAGELVYIEGIGNIYEFDFGDESGWLYFVNGECPSVGCGSFKVKNGDVIEWKYTLKLSSELDSGF